MFSKVPQRLEEIFNRLVHDGNIKAATRLMLANTQSYGRLVPFAVRFDSSLFFDDTVDDDGTVTRTGDGHSSGNPLLARAFYLLLSAADADRFAKLYSLGKNGIDRYAVSVLRWKAKSPCFDMHERAALGKLESDLRTDTMKGIAASIRPFVIPRTFLGKVNDEYTETGTQKVKLCVNREIGWSSESEGWISQYHLFKLADDVSADMPDGPTRYGRKLKAVFQWHPAQGIISKYVKFGGVGGHWGNEQGKLLDVAQSVALNQYLVSPTRSLQWLSDLTLRVEEILSCALHEVDCDVDDGRIKDFDEFKESVITDIARAIIVAKMQSK